MAYSSQSQRPRHSNDQNPDPNSQNPLDFSRLLSNANQRQDFVENFMGKQVLGPKHTQLHMFYPDDVFTCVAALNFQKLVEFHQDCGLYFPDLVRVFYSNLSQKKSTLYSSIKGTSIKLFLKSLGEAVNVSAYGVKIGFGYPCPWEDFDRREFYLSMCRFPNKARSSLTKNRDCEHAQSREILSVGNLTLDNRLLHYFLSYIMVTKASNHGQINDLELQLMFEIKNHLLVNWAFEIMYHMSSIKDNKYPLVYGRMITHILHKFNIDTKEETSMTSDSRNQAFIGDIISRMGFISVSHGIFRHKDDPIDNQDDPAPSQPPLTFNSSPSSGPSNQLIYDEMIRFQGAMTTRLDNLEANL